MEFQKIVNFFDTSSDNKDLPRFATKKWIDVYDQSEKNYNRYKEIRIKTSMLRSDLCDFSDAYIVVKGTITVTERDNAKKKTKKKTEKVSFKNNASFINCISKINGIKIDNAEDLDVVMHLLEYNKNYKKATGSLWNYYRDQPSDPLFSNSESFKYETSITGNYYNIDEKITNYDGNEVDNPKYGANEVDETDVAIPLKHLSNFWRSLNIPLINCAVELILIWSKNCVLAYMSVRDAQNNNQQLLHQLD